MFLSGFPEEVVSRTLPKAIEDDLHRLQVGEFDRQQRLFDFLYADSVIADFSGSDQIIEHPEDFGARIQHSRRAVQLDQIEPVGRKIAQAVFDPC